MVEVDAQLVREIADQVMAILGRGELRARIDAPAGLCTGDDTKLAKLQQDQGEACRCGCEGKSSGQAEAAGASRVEAAASARSVLRGIVTEKQLRQAMEADGQGVAVLAADARLTPLAQDMARVAGAKVQRGSETAANAANGAQGGQWLWWCERYYSAVRTVMAGWDGRFVRMGAGRGPAELGQVTAALAAAVGGGKAVGGVLFVANAARAGCFVNRCGALRAVVGTCEQTVQQGIAEIGANVLIVEVPCVRVEQIEAMVRRIAARPPRVPGAVQRELARLARCE